MTMSSTAANMSRYTVGLLYCGTGAPRLDWIAAAAPG